MNTSAPARRLLLASLLAVPALALGAQDAAAPHEHAEHGPAVSEAIAVLVPVGGSSVEGSIRFERTAEGVRVTGTVRGLTPGPHGFHVHEFGDLSDTATGGSAGSHFAPGGHEHGDRTAAKRHVGDLGNLVADEQGTATIDVVDEVIELEGAHSILGRGLVVHERADDFSQPTGNAGGRVAFAVVGVANPRAN